MRRSEALALAVLLLVGCDARRERARVETQARAPRSPAAQVVAPLTYVERVTAGASPTARLPTLVVIHGLGDRPENFLAVFETLPVPMRVLALRGPAPYESGFAWMTTRVRDGREEALDAEIRESTRKVIALLEALSRRADIDGEVLLAGFSQGGMLTYAVTTTRPDLVRAAFPVGGLLPLARLDALPAPPASAPPIRAFHGEIDTLVPYARDRELVERLRARGWDASLATYPGVRHRIPEAMQRDLHQAIAEALTQTR